jgi:hypothetical protein
MGFSWARLFYFNILFGGCIFTWFYYHKAITLLKEDKMAESFYPKDGRKYIPQLKELKPELFESFMTLETLHPK